jgi:putative glycosyltransferase (TIGR04372 family)
MYQAIRILLRKCKGMDIRYYNKIKTFISIYKVEPEYALSRLKRCLKTAGLILFNIPLLPILLLIISVIRLMRPLYVIRFGKLESDAIGHFSQPIEIYLAEVDCEVHSKGKIVDCWYTRKIICNQVLKNKWKMHLRIVPRLVKPIHLLNRMIPGGEAHEIPYRRIMDRKAPWQVVDVHNVLEKTEAKIKFSDAEKVEYIELLKKSGFDVTKKYVCLSVRDGAYRNDSRFSKHRNSSITEYLDAIDYLNDLGYQVVRIGASVNEKIGKERSSSVFDYPVSGIRSEALDLFLISECTFLIGTGSGLEVVASLFRKPQVYLNMTELAFLAAHSYNSIIIFRKFQIDGDVLSIPSIFALGYDKYTIFYQFKEANIELIKNTKEEINAVLWEMHSRLNGSWESNDEDERLQNLFRSHWPDEPFRGKLNAKIGADFLRSTPKLLGEESP